MAPTASDIADGQELSGATERFLLDFARAGCVAGICAASLGACSSLRDDKAAALNRAEVVRVCADGTVIGHDATSDRLVWSRWSGSGFVARGAAVDQVCAS